MTKGQNLFKPVSKNQPDPKPEDENKPVNGGNLRPKKDQPTKPIHKPLQPAISVQQQPMTTYRQKPTS